MLFGYSKEDRELQLNQFSLTHFETFYNINLLIIIILAMNTRLKIVVIGPSCSGKTSLINQYIYNAFQPEYQPTFSGQLSSIKLNDPQRTLVQIWDLSGASYLRPLNVVYYKDADIILLVYDPSSDESQELIRGYLTQISDNGLLNLTVALITNKRNLQIKKHYKSLQYLKQEFEILHFQVNAKTGYNVKQFFNEIIEIAKFKNSPYVTTQSDVLSEQSVWIGHNYLTEYWRKIQNLYEDPLVQEIAIGILFFLQIV